MQNSAETSHNRVYYFLRSKFCIPQYMWVCLWEIVNYANAIIRCGCMSAKSQGHELKMKDMPKMCAQRNFYFFRLWRWSIWCCACCEHISMNYKCACLLYWHITFRTWNTGFHQCSSVVCWVCVQCVEFNGLDVRVSVNVIIANILTDFLAVFFL